jgi:hypothetical protein
LALIPLILPTPEILLIGTGIFLCSHLLWTFFLIFLFIKRIHDATPITC